MSRFHFHVEATHPSLDEEGTELPSVADARRLAIRYTGELLQESSANQLGTGRSLTVRVTEDAGGEGPEVLRIVAALSP